MKRGPRPQWQQLFRTVLVVAVTLAALALCVVRGPIRPGDLAAGDRAVSFADRDGRLLGTILARDGRRISPVSLDRVAPSFLAAIVSAEDARFAAHGALDPLALARASITGAREHRRPRASTIAVQLARLVRSSDDTWPGIASEIVTAFRLAAGMSHAQILEAYVNRLPMGGNIAGVEAAARAYFGTSAADLDLAQASFLAAIPNDPVGLDPYRHRAALERRRAYVLARMRATGAISAAQAADALAERVALVPHSAGLLAAPHLMFWVAGNVAPNRSLVRTTINRDLQTFVESQLRDVVAPLASNDVRDAAAIVIENRTGAILAYAGSPDYFAERALGRNDGVQALRQPGSALKPFLYELALERRAVRPTSILIDAPVAYALPGGRLYAPHDYGNTFLGPVRMRIALANSLNVPAVRVLERVGPAAFLARLHALGFAHLARPAADYGLGLTLGSGEVSLFELARAYAIAARGGSALNVHAVADANALDTSPRNARDLRVSAGDVGESAGAGGAVRSEGLQSPEWSLITNVLADRYARAAAFGVDSILALPFPAAVKTGTSSDFRDTWTAGYTPEYTVAVWAGNFDGRPMRGISGVSGAGPIWSRIMLHLYERADPRPFAPPAGYARRKICAQSGQPPREGPSATGATGATCGAVVDEYLDRGDLAHYERSSRQGTMKRVAAAAILFPRDGATFVMHRAGPSLRASQRLTFAFAPVQHGGVALDGHALAAESDGAYRWTLRPGTHTLQRTASGSTAAVTFNVIADTPRSLPRGFSYVPLIRRQPR